MNSNQEIKDLVKSIKAYRYSIRYNKNYWFVSGTSTNTVKFIIPIGNPNPKKDSKFKKILLSLFSIFTIYKSK